MSQNNPPATTITTLMAFDWGTQKIGVAVGQRLTGTASPLPEIKARDGIPNWETITTLINEWQPQALVVGIPTNMDGTPSDLTPRARKFGNRLNARFNLPWFPVDERLSSFAARKAIAANAQERGSKPRKGKAVDSIAAALIMETWLHDNP